jgi:tetrapyrrole methylase family protein/MazG family protein
MNQFELKQLARQLEIDPLAQGLGLVDAAELARDAFPRLDTDRPALVFRINAGNVAAAARTLGVNYPPAHPVSLVRNKRVKSLALETLSQETQLPRGTVLYVSPLGHASSPLTLANIMARLRAPVGGCPWDLEQTHESITRSLIEEAYEVIEAIADGDTLHLQEELGDLFLHVLFQTQIARDRNEFSLSEVGAELAAKLIRRHPHVFGDEQAEDASTVLANWDLIKQEEKKGKGQAHDPNALDAGIPRHLPALARAQKVSERARRRKGEHAVGGVPPSLAGALKKKRGAARERAFGELLLGLAALMETEGIDAERALNRAVRARVEKKQE